ncbi:MAG: ATP-dependent DNA helicase RecG [Planctomycetes bacterium]|nr:ATP-dependent DNA helicase RecG [Planctomycetota bacterium]
MTTDNNPATSDPLRQGLDSLGVSPARLELLQRLGLETVGDLLFHFPRAYEDLTEVRRIAELTEGDLLTVQGEVVEIDGRELLKGGCVVSVVLSDDGRHCLEGLWFNQPHAAARFRMGQRLAFSGKPKWFRDYRRNREYWQMTCPRVQPLDGIAAADGGIVPVYPLTENLRVDQLRPVIKTALVRHAADVPEPLPASLRLKHNFLDAPGALHEIHFPADLPGAEQARRRFVYEELLLLQLALALRRREVRDRQQAPLLPCSPAIDEHIRRLLPFRLTQDQDRAVAGVCRDLAQSRPMQRLVQADVGAGKTAVAVYALLVAVANKHQAALMAPTEVLAAQHARTLDGYLARSRVRRLLLTGGLPEKERRRALEQIAAGEIDLVVGTQALVQSDVRFARLGLVVIDEQHKFGVNQRARMRWGGVQGQALDPHYLVMTATPIPRTIALTVFGDLDVSLIKQLPPGRQPVRTRWVRTGQREEVHERVRAGLRQGRQAYVVCPLVEESERLNLKSAAQVQAELEAGPFRGFRVGLLHGRLEDQAKDAVMEAFRTRQLDLLVATSVVEVGIDIANATLMVIEDADRFGLSQLHQLRGRVSRGAVAGECYLFADPQTEEGEKRLRTFVRTTDGFTLAEEDARLRGPGEFFGTRQHGIGDLRFADLSRDTALLHLARKDAFALVTQDATLSRPEHAALRHAVLARYGRTLSLAAIG